MRHLALANLLVLPVPALATPPTVDAHVLTWYVHVDILNPGAGRDLAFYEALIDTAMAEGNVRLTGTQGEFDTPCCTELSRSVSVTTFGTIGDGLDVIDLESEYTTISAIGSGSRGFVVDSLTTCGGPAPTSIGCAVTPSCSGDPNDDPDLWFVVTVDAENGGTFANTTLHERGHNSCLNHVDVDECQIMRPGAGGGCLSASECTEYQNGRTTTGGTCDCHDMAGGIEPDFLACPGSGLCSGGVCGASTGDAQVLLYGAGGPDSAMTGVPDDPIRHAALPGGWRDLGDFDNPAVEVDGMAYADDATTLYGVVGNPSGDDDVVVIDQGTGAITSTLTSRANGTSFFTALAYDPGATSATTDDRLFALESDGTFDDLIEIALPGGAITNLGPLNIGAADGFLGLAYDSVNDVLYTSSNFGPGGLYTIDYTCPGFCTATAAPVTTFFRRNSSLAYSAATQKLYLLGNQNGVLPLGDRLLYDVIDANTLTAPEDVGLEPYKPGALAAMSLPEPGGPLPAVAAISLLVWLDRRRRRARGARALRTR